MTLQELNKTYGMQKKLVLYHSAEIYKRECAASARKGIPTVNCEGQYLTDFARMILKEYRIGRGEYFEEVEKATGLGIMLACALELVRKKKLSYFKQSMLDSGTIRQLLTDIEVLRMENCLDKIADAENEKLRDVSIIAQVYMERLRQLHLYDNVTILEDATTLIASGKLIVDGDVIGTYTDALDEYSAKENDFWKVLCKDKNAVMLTINEAKTKSAPDKQFFRVFGLHNEIHAIVKDVIAKGIPWEQVQIVASTNAVFYPLITYLQKLDIPYCLPEGVSEQYSYAASHIQTYLDNPANFEIDSEGNVNTGAVFEGLAKRLEKAAGNGKLPQSAVASLINKASVCRKNASCYDFEANYYVVVKMIEHMLLGGSFVEDKKEAGAVYIASLSHTEMGFRPYVYLMGFESQNYPGDHPQSPILLDEEMEQIGLPKRRMSGRPGEQLEEKLKRIIASDVKGITISYVSYDTVNMREQNPSAFYQQALKESGATERLFGFAEERYSDILEAREWLLQK
ncbi:MAG: hypothetical protein ACI4F4_05935 [Lachnospiraceae bacterium]